ncbi:MAG: flap endonuclease-1 [Candidatus Woesearchaeota archaeon]
MGTKIFDLMPKKEISIAELKNKTIVIDASLYMYQFMATIRQADGSLLTDAHGEVTSHLVGLFSRSTNYMEQGLKLIFCFDGKPPKLKEQELLRRKDIKIKAKEEYEIAKEREDIELMKKYAARTSRLTPEMIAEAKELIDALGIPIIQAPSEGEAQAAFVVKNKDAYALSTNDADALLFGTPRLIKNLSISQKKKIAGKSAYASAKPEMIELNEALKELDINQDQLIALAMLVGTDFNHGGIKGIGPMKALKLVKEHKDFNKLFEAAKWSEHFEYTWQEVFDTIKNMPVTKDYKLNWKAPDAKRVKALLCGRHGFNEDNVNSKLDKLKSSPQQGLGKFF